MLYQKPKIPRNKKIENTFKVIINEYIQQKMVLPEDTMVSITKVRLNDKMTYLDIELSAYGAHNCSEMIELFKSNAHEIRQYCAKQIHLKYMPEIRFHTDRTIQETLKWAALSDQ